MVLGTGLTSLFSIYHARRRIAAMGMADARRTAAMVFEALFTSMSSGAGRKGNRAVVRRLSMVEDIEDVRLVHGSAIDRQFGVEEDEMPRDEPDRLALSGRETERVVRDGNGARFSRFVKPIVARDICTRCHNVRSGEVLGAISIMIPLKRFDAEVAVETMHLFTAGAGVLVFTVIMSVLFILRVITRPIREFQEAARAVVGGAFNHGIKSFHSLELNVLAEEFNRMASKLRGLTRDLEKKVAERTRELEKEIAERKKSEEALRESEEKMQKITSSAPNAIIMLDSGGRISFWNPASEKIFGYKEEEVMGRDFHLLIVPRKHYEAFKKGFQKFSESGSGPVVGSTIEITALKKDGTEFPVEVSVSAVRIKGRWNAIGVVRDITERKRSEETIRRMAYHDHLTGLPNRLLLMDRIEQAIAAARRHGKKAALLYMDLDRFKDVNDTMGHHVGDELLKAVARRLTETIRGGDTVARDGGDEFTVLLQDINRTEDVSRVTEKIFRAFETPFMIDGREFFINVSIGVSIYPDDGEDEKTLLKNADIAMYQAKDAGRNNCKFFTPEMNERIVRRLDLEKRLKRAVEKEEFLPYYQPQIDLKTGEVTGVEVLLRWQDPERGLVPPGDFITLAEETGLTVPIGEWVMRKACEQSILWQKKGLKAVNIATNFSMRQFREKDFFKAVVRVLEETGLDPGYLEIELTESILMDDVEHVIKTLHEFKSLGVRLAIDDFGTGYSSLEYLRKMPIDMLKIDRSFVRDITTNESDAAIAEMVVNIGHTLDIEVIAEGVETEEQLKLLKEMGCDRMQGFLVARPMPAGDVEAFLVKGRSFLKDSGDRGL